jgi:hypothetical protein
VRGYRSRCIHKGSSTTCLWLGTWGIHQGDGHVTCGGFFFGPTGQLPLLATILVHEGVTIGGTHHASIEDLEAN